MTHWQTVGELIGTLQTFPADKEIRLWCGDDFAPIERIYYDPPGMDVDGTIYGDYVCMDIPDAWDYRDKTKLDAIKRIIEQEGPA